MVILAVTGDWHLNDTTALCPPRFYRERGAVHHPDKFQRAIWRAWLEYWEVVAQYKADLGAPVVGVHNGDLVDVNKHSKTQLISPYEPDIQNALLTVAELPLEICDYNVVVRGTEAHTGGCGKLEEWFGNDIGAEKSPGGHASWWVWRAELEGIRLHVTHHPPTQTRLPNKRGQAVARMCERLAAEYDRGNDSRNKPDLAIWSHIHWQGKGNEMGIAGWTTGCWKGLGAYGYRIGVTRPTPVGGLIVLLDDGKCEVKPFKREPPRYKDMIWTLPS